MKLLTIEDLRAGLRAAIDRRHLWIVERSSDPSKHNLEVCDSLYRACRSILEDLSRLEYLVRCVETYNKELECEENSCGRKEV